VGPKVVRAPATGAVEVRVAVGVEVAPARAVARVGVRRPSKASRRKHPRHPFVRLRCPRAHRQAKRPLVRSNPPCPQSDQRSVTPGQRHPPRLARRLLPPAVQAAAQVAVQAAAQVAAQAAVQVVVPVRAVAVLASGDSVPEEASAQVRVAEHPRTRRSPRRLQKVPPPSFPPRLGLHRRLEGMDAAVGVSVEARP